jgi:adenylate cyclase
MPVRSLQLKFSALVVTLLVVACVGLTWLATQHERRALEVAAERRGAALVVNLAGDAKEPLLAADQLRLEMLAQQVGSEDGLVAVRLLDRDGRVVASLDPAERGELLGAVALEDAPGRRGPRTTAERRGSRLLVAVLVEPEVAESQRQLLTLAVVVVVVGVAGGVIFVALLVGPLRRLRAGVERLAKGDLTVRIPPTSSDEVGELTRAFNQMGESLQQKERIQSAFGRYVSDYVLSQLLEGGETDELGGIEREVTVLFADIRRFTRLSEGLPASRVVSLLNEIFQLASDRILAAGGTIDKFIGDSVMAYFGAPVPQADHAQRAVQAAIDLQRAVAERNQRRAGSDAPIVSLGIGIHTGAVVVGTIGSDRRTDFTAVGDAVNVAQRLEKLARPEEILVSEAVQRRVRGTFKLRFEGERQLSGRLEPVHVYSVDQSPPPARAGAPGPEGS